MDQYQALRPLVETYARRLTGWIASGVIDGFEVRLRSLDSVCLTIYKGENFVAHLVEASVLGAQDRSTIVTQTLEDMLAHLREEL